MKQKLIVQAIALMSCASWANLAIAADDVQKVQITGSNIKRSALETATQVQVLTKKDIEQTGAVTVADLMAKLPALGSNNQVDARDGGFSKGLATASMRALGSASTLVLLNGRRISPAAYADPNAGQSTQYDLNSIPLSALERVEVLKDGASAVYGSDAIAGVINFITKRDFRGGELAVSTSFSDRGKFGYSSANGVYGFGDFDKDGYNAFVSVDLSQRERTPIADATSVKIDEYKAMTGRLTKFYSGVSGYPVYYRESRLGSGSFNTFQSANLGCDKSQQLVGSTALVPMRSNDVLIGKTFCNYDGWQYEDAQGESKSANLLSRGEFKINSTTSAFAEAAYSKSELYYVGPSRSMNGRNPTTVFPKNGAGSSFRPVLGVTHPDNPTRGSANPVPVAVAYRFVDSKGGSENTNTSTRLMAGIKGTNFGWDWDSAFLYNESERHQVSNGFLHLPTIERLYKENIALADVLRLPGLIRNVTLDGKSSIAQWDLKGSTEIGKLQGGAIGLALGLEAKQEKMSLVPDALTVSGQIVGLANQYSNAKRNVNSAFAELRAPFLKSLEMELAGRYDKYDGFKASFTPKAGFKWTPTAALALRATYSHGFRAPSLTQMVDGGTQYFLNNFEDKLRCNKPGADSTDCAKSLSGVAASNTELVPETSRSHTFGMILSPSKNLDILVDYYRIRKEKEVDLLDPISVINNPKYASRVKRDQNQGTWLTDPATGQLIPNSGPLISIETPYVNAGGTDTSGLDLEVNWRASLGDMGHISSRLNATYILHFRKAQNVGDPMFDLVGTNGATSNDTTSIGDMPRLKASLSTNWTYQNHSLTGTLNYISPISLLARYSVQEDGNVSPYPEAYCEYGRAARVPDYLKFYAACEIPSWTTIDVAYAYTGIKNWTLGLNIQNLFDQRAPFDPSTGASTGGFNSTLHNPRGRYITLKANYKF